MFRVKSPENVHVRWSDSDSDRATIVLISFTFACLPSCYPEWQSFVFTQIIIAYTCFTFNSRLLTDALVLLFDLHTELVWFSCYRIISPSIVGAHSKARKCML